MNWGYYIMIAVAVALIGLIGTVVLGIYNDRKGYKKITEKIGDTDKGTLSNQHEMLKEVINNNHNSIKEFIKTGNDQLVKNADFTIEKISDELKRKELEQKHQYDNLSVYQKEIDHYVKGIEDLVRDWKRVVTENTELKAKNENLNNKYKELLNENKKLKKSLHMEQDNDLSL